MNSKRRILAGALILGIVAACGSDDDSGSDTTAAPAAEPATTDEMADDEPAAAGGELAAGSVFVSGSSTVEPISIRVGELAAEQSGGDLAVTVEGPGTGDGFKKFCSGESDVSDASRTIKDSEAEDCAANGINYVELEVAIDGLSVLTNPNNTAVDCLDIASMYALLGPESEGFNNWADAADLGGEVGGSAPFPDAALSVFGPGEESGTYDTFVEFAIEDLAEERGQDVFTRADYSSSANDNFIVEGVVGSDTSLGWVGYSFFAANQDTLKALGVDTGDGCVAPSEATIADGSYGFSRSLYIYVNTGKAAENSALASYVDLYLSDAGLAQVADAGYVDLPADRIAASRAAWAGR
ncbi:MAG: substrate-binding domain-containing protein [Acidimicrobiia bacterium]|nr:substrate-binding domain-containing protein [Acidimicrobiia bacterium]